MHLEVLAEGDEDGAGLGEVGVGGEAQVVQGQRDGQVEAVEGGFVGDDEVVFLHGEGGEVDGGFGGGEEVALLAEFGEEGGVVEELEDGDVGGVCGEVRFQQDVDGGFEHEGVVDGDGADVREAEPAGLAAAGVG